MKIKNSNKIKKLIIAIAISILAIGTLFAFTGCDLFFDCGGDNGGGPIIIPTPDTPPNGGGTVVTPPECEVFDDGLRITFIDVGQGDAALIELPTGERVLIDAGRWNLTHNSFRQDLRAFFLAGEKMQFDWFIATHAHADHIGSADWVVENSYIQNIVRPIHFYTSSTANVGMAASIAANEISSGAYRQFGIPTGEVRTMTTATLRRFVAAMQTSTWNDGTDTNIYLPIAGKTFEVGGAVFTFYSPTAHRYGITAGQGTVNYYSTIFCVYFNGRRILFTGDAYVSNENRILHSLPRDFDIIDLGHHGSNTSTGQDLLDWITPTYAIIQVGTEATGNGYGHPHAPVRNRLEAANIAVFRTDLHGHIIVEISADGEHLRVRPTVSE